MELTVVQGRMRVAQADCPFLQMQTGVDAEPLGLGYGQVNEGNFQGNLEREYVESEFFAKL